MSSSIFPDKRMSDDATDHQRSSKFERDLANLIEPLKTEMSLVSRDLEHRVNRGVANGLADADALFAQLGDDGDARGGLVTQNARESGALDDFFNQIRRESRLDFAK